MKTRIVPALIAGCGVLLTYAVARLPLRVSPPPTPATWNCERDGTEGSPAGALCGAGARETVGAFMTLTILVFHAHECGWTGWPSASDNVGMAAYRAKLTDPLRTAQVDNAVRLVSESDHRILRPGEVSASGLLQTQDVCAAEWRRKQEDLASLARRTLGIEITPQARTNAHTSKAR